MAKTISAILPIFNEEKTLRQVIETLVSSPLISEVICVNDGSTDNSLEILKNFNDEKIKIIDLKKNHGKGYALAKGIKKAKSEILAFFDSDLRNFSHQHIEKLITPILNGNFKAILGVPMKSKADLYRPWVISLTGERVYYKKGLLPHLEKISKTKYGVEIFLNSLYDKKEVKIVPLPDLISPAKWEKRVISEALKEYILEIREIAEEFGKRKGLLPEDYKTLFKLTKVVDFEELKAKVKEIKDKKIKEILEKYLLKYLNLAKRKFKNFFSEGL